MDWQDASTAPKDGRWFLAWNGFWHVACWCDPVREGEGAFMASGMRPLEPPMSKWAALREP